MHGISWEEAGGRLSRVWRILVHVLKMWIPEFMSSLLVHLLDSDGVARRTPVGLHCSLS